MAGDDVAVVVFCSCSLYLLSVNVRRHVPIHVEHNVNILFSKFFFTILNINLKIILLLLICFRENETLPTKQPEDYNRRTTQNNCSLLVLFLRVGKMCWISGCWQIGSVIICMKEDKRCFCSIFSLFWWILFKVVGICESYVGVRENFVDIKT